MLIIDVPPSNQKDKPIRVAIIGTCRARDMLFNAYATKNERLTPKYGSICDLVWYRFSSFTHTTLQAKQYYSLFKNGLKMPKSMHMISFSKKLNTENLTKIAEVDEKLLDTIDLYVIEISTKNNFVCNGFQLNSNYTENNLIRPGGKPMLKWWRSVAKNSENHNEIIEEVINEMAENDTPLSKGVISILKNTKKFVQTPEELINSLKELIGEINKPTIVVPIFNIPNSPIKERSDLIELLVKHSSKIGYNLYDSTGILNRVGREKALALNGVDINHYSEVFHHELVKEFAPFVSKVYKNSLTNKKPLIEKFTIKEKSDV